LPNEPIWPLADEIAETNHAIVEQTGEPFGLLKSNELESACARPYNLWAYDGEVRLAYLGTALIVGIARNHPFEQGNKRTAFVAALIFFENNGYILDYPDTEDFGPFLEAIMVGDEHESVLAEALDDYLVETLV
jgi:death-on-curing protein